MFRTKHLAILLLGPLLAVSVTAQGGGGRSESVGTRSSSGHRYVRRTKQPRREADPVPTVQTGRLSIVINEGGSRVFLTETQTGIETELTGATTNTRGLIVRTLSVGHYKIHAKKAGFFDEARMVEILPDKRRKVVLSLRPQMALLTVNTNLNDSEIDVGGVGKFSGSIAKYFVRPGTYSVSVQRRGYVSQSTQVDLRSAGREQNITIVLQPLRIDTVLSLAAEKLNKGDHVSASALTTDVLQLNPFHAKANRLFGEILLARGDLESTSYFLKSIRNSGRLSLPVNILESGRLVNVTLEIDRKSLSLSSEERVDLNFSIVRSDIAEFRRTSDSLASDHIIIKGRSDFHGRPIEPVLYIYSSLAAMNNGSETPFCSSSVSYSAVIRTCTSDTHILFNTIAAWLELN